MTGQPVEHTRQMRTEPFRRTFGHCQDQRSGFRKQTLFLHNTTFFQRRSQVQPAKKRGIRRCRMDTPRGSDMFQQPVPHRTRPGAHHDATKPRVQRKQLQRQRGLLPAIQGHLPARGRPGCRCPPRPADRGAGGAAAPSGRPHADARGSGRCRRAKRHRRGRP